MSGAGHSPLMAVGTGLLSATTIVGILLGGVHLYLPPAPTDEGSERATGALSQSAARAIPRLDDATGTPAPAARGPQDEAEVQRLLTRSIQQELQRVGCYRGSIDGQWSSGTRAAVDAFNTARKLRLPSASADVALLARLQTEAAKICGPAEAPTAMNLDERLYAERASALGAAESTAPIQPSDATAMQRTPVRIAVPPPAPREMMTLGRRPSDIPDEPSLASVGVVPNASPGGPDAGLLAQKHAADAAGAKAARANARSTARRAPADAAEPRSQGAFSRLSQDAP